MKSKDRQAVADRSHRGSPSLRAQAILKRILKVSHPLLQLYVLKVIKSQVPYCGRKWRQCE